MALTYGELRRMLNDSTASDRDPVMFRDVDTMQLFTVKEAEYEPQSDDGEGDVTSVGGTVWLKGDLC